jgi:hypothetical protein
MIIDKEEHRSLLREVISKSVFHGEHIRLAVEVLDAIEVATIAGREDAGAPAP